MSRNSFLTYQQQIIHRNYCCYVTYYGKDSSHELEHNILETGMVREDKLKGMEASLWDGIRYTVGIVQGDFMESQQWGLRWEKRRLVCQQSTLGIGCCEKASTGLRRKNTLQIIVGMQSEQGEKKLR